MQNSDRAAHVRTQLESIGHRLGLTYRGGDAWVRCPFHGGGNERTPSCKVCVDPARGSPGSYFCFACREKPPAETERWDHFAGATGLVPFRPSQRVHDVGRFSFGDKLGALGDDAPAETGYTSVPKLPLEHLLAWPANPWRTIEPATMTRFDARVLYRNNRLNVYFPVHVNRNYVGGVYAEVEITDADKEAGMLAYVNTAGGWTNDALFGYNLARAARGWLWAVEGPRDTAKTVQLGGRAVGLLGANVSERKVALIEALDPPGIIVALDPDSAGDRAREKLHAAFDRRIPVLDVHFPAGKDPAKMTPRVYARILTQLGLGDGPERTHSERPTDRAQHRTRHAA